jgi:16S rRNA (guanine(527)-N(7))-methyltransferase RsmG
MEPLSDKRLLYSSQELIDRYDPSRLIERYVDLVTAENRNINIVSRETTREDIIRLAAESLVPLEVIAEGPFGHLLDIGSGGGLPAIPLLVTGAVLEATLVERTGKKATALERIVSQLQLPATVVNANLEEARLKGPFDLITLRLVSLTSRLLTLISRLSHPQTLVIYYARPQTSLNLTRWTAEAYDYRVGNSNQDKRFTLLRKKA